MATYDVKQIALPGGDIANLKDGNAIHKSNTSGFVKNDGSIDQNTYQIAQEGKGLSTNDFTNEDKALIGQTLGNNTVLTTDKTPFLTRQTLNPTGFSGYVREKLVGASYAWNQQAEQLLDSGHGLHPNNFLSISVSNGLFSFSAGMYSRCGFVSQTLLAGHKYLVSMTARATSGSGIMYFHNLESGWDTESITLTSSFQTLTKIYTLSENRTVTNSDYPYRIQTSSSCVGEFKNVQFIDLTLAFGSTIADHLYGLSNNGGITKLRDMGCPIDKYTPYGYGLYSVKTSGKKIVGFNLFDEKWTAISTNTLAGTKIKVFPNTAYRGEFFDISYLPSNAQLYFGEYDKDDNLLAANACTIATPRYGFTTKVNTDYVKPQVNHDMGSTPTISFKCCVNFNTPTGNPKNGDYVPYSETTYSLGNDELRGKFDLVNGEIVASGDVKESNGEITRKYGIVNLGSLEWSYNASQSAKEFAALLSDSKIIFTTVSNPNAVCEIYTVQSGEYSSGENKSIRVCDRSYGSYYVTVKDSDYNDAATFKTAMSGKYLIYEKSTPTTEQSTPFADPMSLVGATTEEYIDTRDIPCPVGAERQYMGQSEDIVEIPSMPQSDGIRYMKAITSGGKTQLVWDDDIVEDVSDCFTARNAYTSIGYCHAYKVNRTVTFSMRYTKTMDGVTPTIIMLDAKIRPLMPYQSCFRLDSSGLGLIEIVDVESVGLIVDGNIVVNQQVSVSGTFLTKN